LATVTESSGHGSHSSSVLEGPDAELLVRDLINKLEVANGLKQLLLSKDFTLNSLLNISASDLAEILGIDEYIAKIISSAIKEAVATKDVARGFCDIAIESISDPVLTSVTGAS
jgi:hypothetical protein